MRNFFASCTMPLSLRLLSRDWRAGELRLLFTAICIATAAVCAVAFLGERIERSFGQHTSQLLGADLLLTADHAWSPEIAKQAQSAPFNLNFTQTTVFASTLQSAGVPQLVSVKAVSKGYPLRGNLQTAPRLHAAGNFSRDMPTTGEVWPEARLAAVMNLQPGDHVQLGELELRVGRILLLEPDRGANFANLAPRILMNISDLPATGLLVQGSRARYNLLFAGKEESVAAFRKTITPQLARGESIEDIATARPATRTVIERGVRFLRLASLLSVLLAAVAVALASERFVERHLDGYAIMRCLGAQKKRLVTLHVQEMIWLGILAGASGAALGYLAHFVLYQWLAGIMGIYLPTPSLMPISHALVVSGVLLFGFAAPPLLQIAQVPVLRVLRREYGPAYGEWRAAPLYAYTLGALLLLCLIFWIADDAKLGAYVSLGFVCTFCILLLSARSSLWLLTLVLPTGATDKRAVGFGLRRALLALICRPWGVSLQITALALALLALFLLAFVERGLLENWRQNMSPEAPNRFLINIQANQQAPVANLLSKHGIMDPIVPMVRARMTQIDQSPVSASDFPDDVRAQRLVEREFSLSWSKDLPAGNQIVTGRWQLAGEKGVATVEQGLARRLGVVPGSRLQFNVAGQLLDLKVVGIRSLRWESMQPNFFVMTSPVDLKNFPASYIGSFHLPKQNTLLSRELLSAFPNLTLIDISAILRQLHAAIAQVSRAVHFVFLFTVLAGLLVLYIALTGAFGTRKHTVAMMRALGASRRQVLTPLLHELAFCGLLAGLLAGVVTVICGIVLSRQLLQLPVGSWLQFSTLWPIVFAALAGALFSLAIGARATNRLLNTSPILVLSENLGGGRA